MSRLPSHTILADMSEGNRWSTLDAFARDLRDELRLIDEGAVTSFDGKPLSEHRRDARRKLDRVYAAADDFGDFVGQPDRVRVRVPASSRPISA